MDINLFYFGTVLLLMTALLSIGVRKERGVLFGFVGGVIGIIFAAQLNTDGAIQGLASGAPTGIWPWMYLPILLTIMNFGLALYEGTR